MIKILLSILISSISIGIKSQDTIEIKWTDLKVLKFEEEWSEEFQSFAKMAIFSKEQKELNGKTVYIKGHIFSPRLSDTPEFFLSEIKIELDDKGYPIQKHFGPDKMIELNNLFLSESEYKEYESIITRIKGTLKVNIDNDFKHLCYIIENPKIDKQ